MTALPARGAADVLYLVDLSSVARRCYEAIPPAVSPVTGEPTAAVAGCMGTLVRIIRERAPAFLGVCADVSGPTWRHERFTAYKALRKPPPEDYLAQLRRIARLLALHRVPIYWAKGFEADDLLAAAVARARALELRVVVVTHDKDLLQLVTPEVVCWDGKSAEASGIAEVEAKFGVRPDQVADWLALVGDPTDGVPGVEGIGAKGATELLRRRGTLAEVLRMLLCEKPALAAKLRNGADVAWLSRVLVGLREDAPLAFDLSELRHGGYDTDGIRTAYLELGFRRLAQLGPRPKAPLSEALLARWAGIERDARPGAPAPPVEAPC